MSYLWVDPVQEQANVLTRQLEYFNRKLGEFLPFCRSIRVWRDALNVWICVDSTFSEQVLGAIGRTIFPTFENRQFVDANGARWSHFGYQ